MWEQEYQEPRQHDFYTNSMVNTMTLSSSAMFQDTNWPTFFVLARPLFIQQVKSGFFGVFLYYENEHTAGAACRRGCLLLLGTWSDLHCNGGPCLLKVCILAITSQIINVFFIFFYLLSYVHDFDIYLDHDMHNCFKERSNYSIGDA